MASPRSTAASDDPPPLSFEAATSDADRRAALCLVADSIAQQRQVAARAVMLHPACLAALAALAAAALARAPPPRDPPAALVALAGLALAYLAAVRLATARYIARAEAFRWRAFVDPPDGAAPDGVLVARFGPELIAALVLRLHPRRGGLVRAWTTKLRYRRKGVGADLLRFAVATTRAACGDDAPVAFDPDHANSALALSPMFHGPFRRRDVKAAKALEHALEDYHESFQ